MAVRCCLWIVAWFLWTSCRTLAFEAASSQTRGNSGDGQDLWLRRDPQREGPPLLSHFVADTQLRRPWADGKEQPADFQAYFEGSGDVPTSYGDYHIPYPVTAVHNHDVASPVAPSASTPDENLVRSSIPYLGPSSTIDVLGSSLDFGYDYIIPSSSEPFIEPSFVLSSPWSEAASRTLMVENFLPTPVTSPVQSEITSYDTNSIYQRVSVSPTPTVEVEPGAVTRVTEWSADTSLLLGTPLASPGWPTGDPSAVVSSQVVPKEESSALSRTSSTITTVSFVAVEPTGTDHAVAGTEQTEDTRERPEELSGYTPVSDSEKRTTAIFSTDNSDAVSQYSLNPLDRVTEAAATSSGFSGSEARTGSTEDSITSIEDGSTDIASFSTGSVPLLDLTEKGETMVSATVVPAHGREGPDSVSPLSTGIGKTSTEPVTATDGPEMDSTAVNDQSTRASSVKFAVTDSTAEPSAPAAPSSTTHVRVGKNFPLHMAGTGSDVSTIPLTTSKDTSTEDVRLQPESPSSSVPAVLAPDSSSGPPPTQRSSVPVAPGTTELASKINFTTPPTIDISSVTSSFSSRTLFTSRFQSTSATAFGFSSGIPYTAATPRSGATPSDTNFWDRFKIPTKASETTIWLLTTASRLLTAPPAPSAWTSPRPLLPVPATTVGAAVTATVPQSSPLPYDALNEKSKYWIRTVLRMKDIDQTDPEKLASQLAFVYEKAFAQSRAGRRGRRSTGRSTSLHVIHLAMDYKDRLMSLVYALSRDGKLVPAEVAVDTMSVVNDTDMSNLLGYDVVTKAEPYVESHKSSKALVPLTWIVIGVLAGILVFVIVCLLLYCKCCRPKYPDAFRDAESIHSFGKHNRKKVFESSQPDLGTLREKSYKNVFTSPIHFPSAPPLGREKRSPRDGKARNLSEYYVNKAYEPDKDLQLQSAAEITPHVRRTKGHRSDMAEDQPGMKEILEAEVGHVPPGRRDPNEAPLPLPRKSLPKMIQPISDSDTSLESSISTASTERAGISPPDSATTSLLPDETSSGTSPSDEDLKEARKQLDKMKHRISGVLDDTGTKSALRNSQKRTRVCPSTTLERQAGSFRSSRIRGHPTGGLARTRSADDLDSCGEYPVAGSEAEVPETRDADTQTTADLPMVKPRIVWSIYKIKPAVPESSSAEPKPKKEEWCLPDRASTLPDSTTAPTGLREPTNSVIRAIRGELRKFNATHTKPNGESFA